MQRLKKLIPSIGIFAIVLVLIVGFKSKPETKVVMAGKCRVYCQYHGAQPCAPCATDGGAAAIKAHMNKNKGAACGNPSYQDCK